MTQAVHIVTRYFTRIIKAQQFYAKGHVVITQARARVKPITIKRSRRFTCMEMPSFHGKIKAREILPRRLVHGAKTAKLVGQVTGHVIPAGAS